MRKPNIELNQIKLAQKQLQLTALARQLQELDEKRDFVTKRLESKQEEVALIESILNGTVTPAVSE